MRLVSAASVIASLVLLGSQVAAQKDRIVFHTLKSLVTARIDPIIYPGVVSQHAHHVVGGSAFNPTYNADAQRGGCTNLGVQADKSNYWAPVVYRVLSNGSYVGMPTNTRIYYEQPLTKPGVNVEPFPYSFRMIAGDPSRKTVRPLNQGDILQMFYCEIHDTSGKIISTSTTQALPTQPCTILTAKTYFPTCWNGNAYDPSNPSAHMQYPLWGAGYKSPNCPTGFERRLPSILMEVYHFGPGYYNPADQPPASKPGQMQYILANGDTTGYGLHADFANGWDTAVLQNMITNCKTGPVEEPPNQACAALAPSFDYTKGQNCDFGNDIPNEPVGYTYALSYLPGCNLPWTSGPKPVCSPRIFKGDPGWIKPAADTNWG